MGLLSLSIIQNKKVVVFGAGGAAKRAVGRLALGVAYYVDNNPNKWGTLLEGKRVLNPAVLQGEDHDSLAVVIASMYDKEISEQLAQMGLAEHAHFWNADCFFGGASSGNKSLEETIVSEYMYGDTVILDWSPSHFRPDTTKCSHIHFLNVVATEEGWFSLQELHPLLKRGRIDFIKLNFEPADEGHSIDMAERISQYGYKVYRIASHGLIPGLASRKTEDAPAVLAVHQRLVHFVEGRRDEGIDLQRICLDNGIRPRGVIHIGANKGQEYKAYRDIGIRRMLFIEANPHVFAELSENIGVRDGINLVNCAITNFNGFVKLHITNMDQSSSILTLKEHQDIYPDIVESRTLEVKARTLDTLLLELGLDANDYNMLNIDIQGAELLALKGAVQTLRHTEILNTEINYIELYEGCALLEHLDEFLEKLGFERRETRSPHHMSWGDAVYLRRPVVTMSTLGSNGRFGNQLFQYAFLKWYAAIHHYRVETSPWAGQYLFGHRDSQISAPLPQLKETHPEKDAPFIDFDSEHPNVDFWGYFQFHTRYWAEFREPFIELFRPIAEIQSQLNKALEQRVSNHATLVGIHLRRGDFGYGYFFVAPCQWYKDWLRTVWNSIEYPVLYIASDGLDEVIEEFAEYNPITSRDLENPLKQAEEYLDFYVLTQCKVVAISNSSFSFAACMLNQQASQFYRPKLTLEALIPFDPWNSPVLLREDRVKNKARARLERSIDRIPADASVLIYGGGEHTEQLLSTTRVTEKKICGIVDKQPVKTRISGYNVRKPEFITECSPDVILISSLRYQKEIHRHLIHDYHYKGQIICIYEEEDRYPFYIDVELGIHHPAEGKETHYV